MVLDFDIVEYRRLLDIARGGHRASAEVLMECFNFGHHNIQKEALMRPNFPLEKALEVLRDPKRKDLHLYAVHNREFRGELLYLVKDHPSRFLRGYVGRYGLDAPVDLLMYFLNSGDRNLVHAVARNYEAPDEVLEAVFLMDDVRNSSKDKAFNILRRREPYKTYPVEWLESMFNHKEPRDKSFF